MPKKVASPPATSNSYYAQLGLEFYPDETSTKFNPLLTIGYVGKREREREGERGMKDESKK